VLGRPLPTTGDETAPTTVQSPSQETRFGESCRAGSQSVEARGAGQPPETKPQEQDSTQRSAGARAVTAARAAPCPGFAMDARPWQARERVDSRLWRGGGCRSGHLSRTPLRKRHQSSTVIGGANPLRPRRRSYQTNPSKPRRDPKRSQKKNCTPRLSPALRLASSPTDRALP
jgi:hypothetical protein